jgi:hypothetical protein
LRITQRTAARASGRRINLLMQSVLANNPQYFPWRHRHFRDECADGDDDRPFADFLGAEGINGDSDPNSRACFILQCSAVN